MAKLYFTFSAMNAGKSSTLLQAAHNYREQKLQVQLWTSSHHAPSPHATRGQIESRIGLKAPARVFRPGLDLYRSVEHDRREGPLDALFFDEAQFLTRDQVWALARVADEFDIPVLCYGLRTDFQGVLFDGAAELLALADDLREARTLCHCGKKATMNLRVDVSGRAITDGDQVGVEKAQYVAMCRAHWRAATEDAGQGDLSLEEKSA